MLVAFSGGVDSSLILKLAVQAATKTGHKVYGIMVHTMLHPMGEVELSLIHIWLWCEYARIIGASYYDQFLCKWNCCGKY